MTRLLKITDLGSGIMVQGTNNVLYPDNATLTYPYNSIIVVTDESNIATFRSASNNDVLFSGLIGKIEIGGEIVTKENINTKFDAIANKESGGGDVSGLFADASYDSQTKRINFLDNGGNIVSYIDATDFIKDGMVSNVAISEGNLVITFNTDAGQEPISIALTDIFNSENYYNKTEVDGKLALKADKTELPDVSTLATKEEMNAAVSAINSKDEAQDAEIALKAVKADVDAALALKADKSEIPDTSEFLTKTEYNPKELATAKALTQLNETKADKTELPDVSTFATKSEVDAVKAYYIDFAVLSTQGITDADWDGIVAAINAHRPIYAGLGNRYYTAECLYQDGSNIIRMTASDELNHFFYLFTKRGTNDYSFTYETRPYTTQAEKDAWSAKQDALVSGTNIKTINNESILGEGNITIEGGMDEDTELLISSALVDLNDRKIDATEVKENYQKKGDYATNAKVDTKANISDVPTNEDYEEAQKITSWSLNDLNARFGGLKLEKITQSAYDALATKDSSTVYFIKD